MTVWFTALCCPTRLPFNLSTNISPYSSAFLIFGSESTPVITIHPQKQFSVALVISSTLFFKLVFTSADLPCFTVSFSLSLSLTPVTVSKVLMRSYLTLHCLIRCCWVSEFAASISWGQLNAILCWISPCNPVCCLPARPYISAPTVDWLLQCLHLQHTTAPPCQTTFSMLQDVQVCTIFACISV